jgi:hypothetical protein
VVSVARWTLVGATAILFVGGTAFRLQTLEGRI